MSGDDSPQPPPCSRKAQDSRLRTHGPTEERHCTAAQGTPPNKMPGWPLTVRSQNHPTRHTELPHQHQGVLSWSGNRRRNVTRLVRKPVPGPKSTGAEHHGRRRDRPFPRQASRSGRVAAAHREAVATWVESSSRVHAGRASAELETKRPEGHGRLVQSCSASGLGHSTLKTQDSGRLSWTGQHEGG